MVGFVGLFFRLLLFFVGNVTNFYVDNFSLLFFYCDCGDTLFLYDKVDDEVFDDITCDSYIKFIVSRFSYF